MTSSKLPSHDPDDANEPLLADRLLLRVPYCQNHIELEVLFNQAYPAAPPDIIVLKAASNDEQGDWLAVSGMQTLANWPDLEPAIPSSGAFACLVDEIRQQFALHQQQQVSQVHNSRLNFEYNCIVGIPGVEFRVDHVQGKVQVLVPIKVDLDVLHVYTPQHSSRALHYQDACFLFVDYQLQGESAVEVAGSAIEWPPQLLAMPWLADAGYPSITSHQSLLDFKTESLEPAINECILKHTHALDKRREVCDVLRETFSGHLLEWDSENFEMVSFLFVGPSSRPSRGKFSYIVQICLGEAEDFPAHQPLVRLLSATPGCSTGYKLRDLRYDASYSAQDVAAVICNRLKQ
eukprot:gene11736-2137_t